MGVMSSQPIIEPMEVEVQKEEEVRYIYVCVQYMCYVYGFCVTVLILYLVYNVVIQGEVLQDNDVFRNVVISNVCVWIFVCYL